MNTEPQYPRMSADVYHPCLHLFTTNWNGQQVTDTANQIKQMILGDAGAPTSFEGPKGKAQLAIQTEFIVTEYSAQPSVDAALELLDSRLDALFEAGFAVHLLLPVHNLPQPGWEGVDWQALQAEWPGSGFVPYQPSVEEFNNGQQCPYDILAEKFQQPIVEHLVQTGRAKNLAVIYLMNEFGYPGNTLNDSAKNWNNDPNWKVIRAQALANTAERVLSTGRKNAAGTVPVGLKFARLTSPDTGWTPFNETQPDQLSNILNIMGPAGDILGYDVYFNDQNNFDEVDRDRLAPFFPLFPRGFFELSETGRECGGSPCDITSGARTSAQDIMDVTQFWSDAQGCNLYAWNSGCYSIVGDDGVTPCPGGEDEIQGLYDLAIEHSQGS